MGASRLFSWSTWAASKSDRRTSIVAALVALALCSACRSAASPATVLASPTPASTAIAAIVASVASPTVPSVSATTASPMPPTPSPTPVLTGYINELPTEITGDGYPAPYNPPTARPTPAPTALVAPTVPIAPNAISPANAANLQPAAPIAPPSFEAVAQMASWWQSDLGPVLDAAFSLDGARLAVAKAFGVFVYDLHTLQPVRFIDTATAIPRRVFFTADGNGLLVSTHDDGFGVRGATFFDILSGQRAGLIRVEGAANGIDSTIARLSPDGRILLVQRNYGAELYDAATRRPLPFWPQGFAASTFAFSPDSRLLATGFGAVTVWEVATQSVAFNATDRGTAAVQQPMVAFSRDGSVFGTTDGHRLVLWDVGGRAKAADVLVPGSMGVGSGTGGLWFAPDNRVLAMAAEGHVALWRVPGGDLALKTSGTGALFSPDSTTLLIPTDQHRIEVWDVTTGQERIEIAGDSPQYAPDGRLLIKLAANTYAFADAGTGLVQPAFFAVRPRFAPDGRLVDIADDASVRILDGSGQTVQKMSLRPEHSPMTSVAFLRDGRLLMAFGNGTLRLQTDDPQLVNNPFAAVEQGAWIYQVVAAPDGQSFMSASKDGTLARFTADEFPYDPHETFGSQPGELTSTDISRDGLRIAAGSSDDTVKLWDATSSAITPTRTLAGHTSWVWSVAFSPDGKRLASGSADWTVRLWDVGGGAPVRVLAGHTGTVHSVAFSPDGSLVASGAWDGRVTLWDAASGAFLRMLTTGQVRVNQVAFSRDGQVVAAAVDDGTVRLWESATGRSLATLHPDGGAVWAIAFSPDGRRLAAAMNDGTARLWEAP